MSDFTWSPEQETIFAAGLSSANLAIRARAGTGKTTTIIQLAKRLVSKDGAFYGKKTVFVAFNKSIQQELEGKVPAGMSAKTAHSLGLAALRREVASSKLDANKTSLVLKSIEKETQRSYYGYAARIKELVGWAKNAGMNPFEEDSRERVERFTYQAITRGLEDENMPAEALAAISDKVLVGSLETTHLHDFDDMLWLPFCHGWLPYTFDLALVDEAQDLNIVQHWLVSQMVRKNGRLIIVGDDRQAIYGWRGAVSSSFDALAKAHKCEVLPLKVTRRCPKAVVQVAQRIVPDFEADSEAPQGLVTTVPYLDVSKLQYGDAVLSRINGPIMKLCLDTLLTGKRARIIGSNIGKQLRTLVTQSKATSLTELTSWLDAYLEKQKKRFDKPEQEDLLTEMVDKVSTLRAMVSAASDLAQLESMLNELFVDATALPSESLVTFSTAHRAKGMEFDRVYLLPNFCRSRSTEDGEQRVSQEEQNVYYVAVTRAKKHLVLIQSAE